MPAWFQAVWPVVVFFLGGLAKFASDERSAARQRALERLSKNDRLADRREQFELTHLVDLNDALSDLARAVTVAHLADLRESEEAGKYASTLLPDGISDEILLANRRVHTLEGLVLDDALRKIVEQAHSQLNVPAMMYESSPTAARTAHKKAMISLDKAQSMIAERIRTIYLNQDAR